MANDTKKGLNTNSNTYTIIYSAIMVIIVAFLLAFVYQMLKDRQDANVALDKKKQILYALNIRGLSDSEAAAKYNEVVLSDVILNDDSIGANTLFVYTLFGVIKVVVQGCNSYALCQVYVATYLHWSDNRVVQSYAGMVAYHHISNGIVDTDKRFYY